MSLSETVLGYLRLAAYVIAAVFLFGLGWYFNGCRWQAKYNAIIAANAELATQELIKANARNEALQSAYDDKLKEITDAHEKDMVVAHSAADRLARSLHDYQTSRCPDPVPKGAAAPSISNGTASVSGSDAGITEATRRVLTACAADSEELIALQAERRSLVH